MKKVIVSGIYITIEMLCKSGHNRLFVVCNKGSFNDNKNIIGIIKRKIANVHLKFHNAFLKLQKVICF